MKCRNCKAKLNFKLIDLGSSPPSNAYLTEKSLKSPESWFPLKVMICIDCGLVQTEDYTNAETLFDSNYAYFSGFSDSWLTHSKNYVDLMISKYGIKNNSLVIEVAANDGYLLQFFKKLGIPSYGIEPTASTAASAIEKGIDIIQEFFSEKLAKELSKRKGKADLMVANNVLAHVPDINDFVKGFSILLNDNGIVTFEFPHLLKLIEENQFDTIYHEHFSYLSLNTINKIFLKNNLEIFDVEELDTHGGSLRVFAQKHDSGDKKIHTNVKLILLKEEKAGLNEKEIFLNFQNQAEKVKLDLLKFLIESKQNGKRVVAYGAAAKGNTLLNFAGVREDLISYIVDRNPAKQNKFMPGSRIKIVDESYLEIDKPDFILILPWNLKNEIKEQLDYSKSWGAKLLVALPKLDFL